jgi:hypothetical protein
MALATALDLIKQAVESSAFDEVGISGGEALLYEKEVLEIIEYASALGLDTSLTSNGFWGETPKKAQQQLALLKETGLTHLIVSTDEFHQPFVSYRQIENILSANETVGISLKIYDVLIRDTPVHPLENKYQSCVWLKGKCLPAGRALRKVPSERYIYGDYDGCCPVANILTIMPDGFAYPCCSPGIQLKALQIGSVAKQSIGELVQEKENATLLRLITQKGPAWIIEAGAKRGCFLTQQRDEYVSACHLCQEIFADTSYLKKMAPHLKELRAGIDVVADYQNYLKL